MGSLTLNQPHPAFALEILSFGQASDFSKLCCTSLWRPNFTFWERDTSASHLVHVLCAKVLSTMPWTRTLKMPSTLNHLEQPGRLSVRSQRTSKNMLRLCQFQGDTTRKLHVSGWNLLRKSYLLFLFRFYTQCQIATRVQSCLVVSL